MGQLSVFIVICLALLIAQQNADAADCACATTSLHVRSAPSTDATILHTMPPGECLSYRGDTQTGSGYTWLHLTYNGQSAWAAQDWLTVEPCGSTSSSTQLPGCPRIISRAEWGARAPTNTLNNMPALPIYVFVHHSAGSECFDQASCINQVRLTQNYHMDGRGYSDVGYNFLVGEDGHAYEGRGWSHVGAHTLNYNTNGIAICVFGDFTDKVPNDAALNTVKQLISCGLSNHKINPNYTLKGHRDVGATACPGTQLYNLIHSWPHYAPGTEHFTD